MFALADCNNFFCSCERVFHPELRNRPVVVLSNNDGCVVARSNESKALGIKMGDVFFQVRDILERNNVAVFSSNYNLYGDMSRRVMSLLAKLAPSIDVYSVDEAFLDFNGLGDSEAMVARAREIVRTVTKGTGIPISMGIAPTKTLAKIATKFSKKYPAYKGVCIIDTDLKREKALKLVEIGDIWGIGHRYARKLIALGVNTAWDLTQKHPDWVKRNLTVVGLRTWKELRGESCISIDDLPHKKSICTSRSFPDSGLNRLADLEEAVANFAAQCSRKLRNQHTVCGGLTLFAYTSRFRLDLPQHVIVANARLTPSTSCLTEIVDTAIQVLRKNWGGEQYKYKKAGVIVWDISPDNAVQLSLFDAQDRTKLNKLQIAIDSVNRLNGHNTVRTAVQGYNKKWHIKTEYLSHQYTTNLNDILRLNSSTDAGCNP